MKPSERLKKQIEKEGIKAYESKTYTPKKQKKAAERSAPSLRSQGQSVEVVKDTGMGTALSNLRDRANKPTVRINTDKGFTAQNTTVNPVIGWKPADMTKSTAKDEKTRLYETNDSLLNSDEIIKKYQYVAQDKDMDDETLQRAVKKGMSEVRRTLRGTNDMSRYETVAKLQTELQGRLKSASFMAGFLNSMGGDLAKIVANVSGNEQIQKNWGNTLNQLQETQEANATAGTLGALTGEFAKAGAGYATIGKAAEKKALDVAGKALGGKALTKGGEIATRMIGQQVADTAVNTPITVLAGLAEDKSGKEIAKDVGKQMALDAAFNVGLEGLNTVGGIVRAKNAQKKIPQQLEDSMTGNMKPNEYIELGETPEILKRFGMIDGEMRMPQSIVPKTAYPAEYRQALARGEDISENQIKKIQGHNLGFEAIRELPEKMRNPVAILKSDTQKDNLVVLTDMVDRAGRPVIVPIRVDKNGTTDFGTIIPSMYGRKDFADFMERQEKKGNILYYDKKRNLQQLPNSGVQFPESFNASADPMLRIAERSEKVNDVKAAEKNLNMKNDDFSVEMPANTTQSKAKQVYQEDGFTAVTGMKAGKEITRYTNPALDKNPLEMEGVKELLNDSDFDMMDADATDYSAALGIKPISWTANKDFYRVMEEAGSLNPAAKEMLEKEIVTPVKSAKDSYIAFEKEFFQDILPVVQKTGIRRGTKESAAVQWYREGERLNAFGKKEPYSLAKLKQEFPDKWRDIVELDEVLQKWLKSMPAPLNENFKKIYPNVEANAVAEMKKHQLASEDFFKKARAEQERIDALEKRLGELKQQTAKDGTRKKTDLEKRIINKERQIEKAKAEKQRLDRNAAAHSKKAKKWEDDIANGDIYENKRLLIRENYYPHMTKKERGFKGLKAIGEMNQNIDPRLEGVSEFTQPKTKWAGFMQHRKDGYYDADALGNTIDYMQQAGYKLYFDPVIANNRKVIKGIAEATKDSRNANGFLNFMTQYTNDLAGKTNPYFDRMLTNIGGNGRKVIAGLEWLNNRVKSNAVMGNFRSMAAQVFNIPNAAAYVKNPVAWGQGAKILGDMFTGRNGAKELMDSSTFLSERYTLDKLLNQFEEKNIGNSVERLASWMMTVGDEFATRLIWASAYSDAAKKGVSDAVRYADDIARKAVGGRGIGEMPILQKSRVYKFAVPFSLEVNNSFQVLKETVAKNDLAGLALMMGASYAMNSIPRELFGFDVSTDFVNALKEGVEEWDSKEQTFAENMTGVTGRLAGELISAIPSGAILSTLAFDEYKREKFFGDADPTRYGVGQVGVTTLTDPILDIMSGEDASGSLAHAAFSILPNVGGKTLERAYEGLQDMAVLPDVTLGGENGVSVQQRKTAGSYKDNGELRFPIESTPGNIAKLFAFGEYATKEGKRYLEDTNSTLSANQTETYEKLVAAGAKNTIAFETISRIKAKEKSSEKRSAIRSSMLSDEQKAILYYELVAEKDSKDRQTLDWYGGRTSRPQVADALSRIAEYSGNDMAKRSVLRNSDLSESDKRYLYLNNVLNEASVEIETERLDAAQSVDIDINTYFTIRNKYSRLKEQGGKIKNNWISWMRSEGYSGRQIYVMGEAFGWNMD